MARYTDHDQLGAAALELCEAVREIGPLELYRRLAAHCVRDPERMAQILMCLAAWVDYDGPAGALTDRAAAIVECRVQSAGARSAS
ncbi:hypothetical protein ACFVMC_00450 [Nocardia sp. NPDC127579]|uniref:hypothetical protein n=1 Tax=Nocardia sp. NPDC127579 TaxID=3345402 RepID=UPI00363E7CBD